ncbi:MAG: MATE family efflux transporter [Lachnospiraceae bacterium]|nr:MATE family efflux transporter [Lachnospiraceae bacterium]
MNWLHHQIHGSSHTGSSAVVLTKGPIVKGIVSFAIPVFLGQLLQQLYNMADAWVIGNFASTEAFAAVSSGGSLTFMIIGFFNGIAIGGGVIISRYFGAKEEENVQKAVHNNVLFGIVSSIAATIIGLTLVPHILVLMNTPENVLPYSLTYFRIYCAGVSTVIMYNIFMSVMRALGDSVHPLYYLIFSSLVNVMLDLVLVAGFGCGVAGAAAATVTSQGLSVILCLIRMCRLKDYTRLDIHKLRFDKRILSQIITQGLPTGIQNSVISLGNLVVQTNINSFGAYAMSGQGAYAKIEGFVFLPIMSMSMSLPTFVSQNLGARQYDRAKKGAIFGIASGMILAELVGVIFYIWCPYALRFFVDSAEAVSYGTIHARTVAPFFLMLAFSHCAAGVMRGCGKSFVPMLTMLAFWCGVRILYVTVALRYFPVYQTIAWAYPLTWSLSSVVFLVYLLRSDWLHSYEKKEHLS